MQVCRCAGVQVCRCAGGRAGGCVQSLYLPPSPLIPPPPPWLLLNLSNLTPLPMASHAIHIATTTNITPTPAPCHACAATTPSRAGHAGADTAKYASQVLVAQFLQHMRQVETPSGGRFGDRKVSVRSAQMRARPIVVSTWRVFTPKTSP